MIDNHLHQGNALGIDPRTVTWKRVVDLNDRALREVVIGLGGVTNGVPREDGFDIVVASEVMAILCLADSLPDLKRRLGDIVVGYRRDKTQVTARDLEADGAMAVLLRDAVAPNLVQTLEHTPAFIHGGPFAQYGWRLFDEAQVTLIEEGQPGEHFVVGGTWYTSRWQTNLRFNSFGEVSGEGFTPGFKQTWGAQWPTDLSAGSRPRARRAGPGSSTCTSAAVISAVS